MQKPSLPSLLLKLWSHFEVKRRIQFVGLAFLMIVASFAELLSVGSIMPFLAAVASPEKLFATGVMQPIIALFQIENSTQLVFYSACFFGFGAILAGAIRLFLLWMSSDVSFAAGADLSTEIFRKTIYQPYEVHISRNSSEIISAIAMKANIVTYRIINPILAIISAFVMFLIMLLALLFVNPWVGISIVGIFSFIYAGIIFFTRKKLFSAGERIGKGSDNVIKVLQESLGGIRDVLLDRTQEVFIKIYKQADISLRMAEASNQFIGQSPRFLIEALGMIVIAFIAFHTLSDAGGVLGGLPFLGAIALGAQRLLPILQQAYFGWASIKGSQASLADLINLLDQPMPALLEQSSSGRVNFSNAIYLDNISFRHSTDTPWILKDANLEIPKGSRVGIIGSTGSGKSTLLDILMGLLTPTEGRLRIDDVPLSKKNLFLWQSKLAHVPQTIFLSDASIASNIAFGTPLLDINYQRIRNVASLAQISEVIESWTMGYDTQVGERGVRLSGGQRQRIGIARALYKNSEIILFDEATSALDVETERSVMGCIDQISRELTIIIVAHRVSTLHGCDYIYELKNGKLKECNQQYLFEKS
jgi:ATP-binding cassette subfamily B protein